MNSETDILHGYSIGSISETSEYYKKRGYGQSKRQLKENEICFNCNKENCKGYCEKIKAARRRKK